MAGVLEKRHMQFTVVLVNIENPGNVAAIMRTCDAVGIQDIYLLTTRQPREKIWKRRASRSAEKWITLHEFSDTKECFSELLRHYPQVLATHLGQEAIDLYSLNLQQPTAFVFGNEEHGLDEAVLQFCTGNIVIPQIGMLPSLNISVACAVTLYEAYRQNTEEGGVTLNPLPAERINQLHKLWTEA